MPLPLHSPWAAVALGGRAAGPGGVAAFGDAIGAVGAAEDSAAAECQVHPLGGGGGLMQGTVSVNPSAPQKALFPRKPGDRNGNRENGCKNGDPVLPQLLPLTPSPPRRSATKNNGRRGAVRRQGCALYGHEGGCTLVPNQ